MLKSFYLSALTPPRFVLPLYKGTQLFSNLSYNQYSCPTLAKCSCYLGLGGQAASHLCPLTNLVNQVNSTLMTMQL